MSSNSKCHLCGENVENQEDGDFHKDCRKSVEGERYLEDVIFQRKRNIETGETSDSKSFTDLSGSDLFFSQVNFKFYYILNTIYI